MEVTKDDELLSLMRQAGVTQVYHGFESVQPETLIEYDKHQTLEKITAAVEKLHSFGFRISGSFVVGADTDTLETLRHTVDFVLEQNLTIAYFFPIWGHYPEQIRGYQAIIPWYRSIFRGWGYCDGNFVTHYPLHIPPSKLQRAIVDAYHTILSPTRIVRSIKRGKFADAREKSAHRYMWWTIEKGLLGYVPFLEELEDGLYDAAGHLREDLLMQRVQKDPRWTFQAGNRAIETLGLSPLELPLPGERNITCVPPKLDSRHEAGVSARAS